MDADPESLLLGVVGEVLSSVGVVADYVELDFNGPRLSLFVWPTITIDGERPRQLGDPGYRDSLCSLIGRVHGGSAQAQVGAWRSPVVLDRLRPVLAIALARSDSLRVGSFAQVVASSLRL